MCMWYRHLGMVTDVRRYAVKTVGRLVEAAPTLTAEALPHVVKVLRFGDGKLRMHAADAVRKLV